MSFKFLAKIGNIFITRKCLLSFFEITKFGYNSNKKNRPEKERFVVFDLLEEMNVLFQSNFLRRLFIWLPTFLLLNGWSALERTLLK